jgi:hypothetical protein
MGLAGALAPAGQCEVGSQHTSQESPIDARWSRHSIFDVAVNVSSGPTEDGLTAPPRRTTDMDHDHITRKKQKGGARRLGVTVREAGWLFSMRESRVRRLVTAGVIRRAVAPGHLSPDGVRRLFPDDGFRPLREAALEAVLENRIYVPTPATRYARPTPITSLPDYLYSMFGK